MAKILSILLLASLVLSCQNTKTSVDGKPTDQQTIDTLVGREDYGDVLSAGAYPIRATKYFLIVKGDTSDVSIYLTERRNTDKISMGIPHNLFQDAYPSYRQSMDEFPALLAEAKKEYNLDSLDAISLNSFVTNGDLAIILTQEVLDAFPKFKEKPVIMNKDYSMIFDFLKKSRLANDINHLFKPYHLAVKDVWGEKLHFTGKEWLYKNSVVEMDSMQVPDHILNGAIGVRLVKTH